MEFSVFLRRPPAIARLRTSSQPRLPPLHRPAPCLLWPQSKLVLNHRVSLSLFNSAPLKSETTISFVSLRNCRLRPQTARREPSRGGVGRLRFLDVEVRSARCGAAPRRPGAVRAFRPRPSLSLFSSPQLGLLRRFGQLGRG